MEYEYSFNVSNVDEYINYCKKNKYKLKSQIKQIRTIYRNNGVIARITKEMNNKKKKYTLDFKEDKLSNEDLIIRKESKKIVFDSINNCEDILLFLGFKKDNTLDRTRHVYSKNKVTFEIDIYKRPKKAYVIAIEGDKFEVDKVYMELNELNKKYKL